MSAPPEAEGGMKRATKGSLLKVIRAYCMACCLQQPKEIRLCPDDECPNWPYRFGTDPEGPHPGRSAAAKASGLGRRHR